MKIVSTERGIETVLHAADRRVLRRIATTLAPLVKVEPLGRYRTMAAADVWWGLLGQVCVMGSARPWDQAQLSTGTATNLTRALAFSAVAAQPHVASYLEDMLRKFKATRFHKKAAEKLTRVLQTPSVFRGSRVALFEGISHRDDPVAVRNTLIKRCPIFRLKSASDFMISVGLSHDVIALDTRIVGILRRHCEFDHKAEQIQSSSGYYLSVESALRAFCREQQFSLALLDRLLFQFSALSAIDLVVKFPRLRCMAEGSL